MTDYNRLKIGRVLHFYDKIKVAIVELDAPLAMGEEILFSRGGEDMFTQVVDSIQVEHEKVSSANKGDIVGIRLNNPVKEDAEVYKISY